MSEHRALDAREVVESLRACEDKQCKDCAIGSGTGHPRTARAANNSERTRNHERREL